MCASLNEFEVDTCFAQSQACGVAVASTDNFHDGVGFELSYLLVGRTCRDGVLLNLSTPIFEGTGYTQVLYASTFASHSDTTCTYWSTEHRDKAPLNLLTV